MVNFPKSITYNDENKPDWMYVIKENDEQPFQLVLTLESWDRISLDETNIEGLHIDLNKAISDALISAYDINAIITFLRISSQKVTFVINGTGTDLISIVLPPGITVRDVVRSDGFRIPFTIFIIDGNIAVSFVVTFSSIVEIDMFIRSVQYSLNTAVNVIAQTLIVSSVLSEIVKSIGEIVREVRERV